jgi:guanine nucleotide-binding protein subunit alpha
MKLVEDERVNRMQESLELFQEIGSSRLFQDTLLIVLYNKLDVFKHKLAAAPLSTHFTEFRGTDWQSSLEYIQSKFSALYCGSNMVNYVTCTIDTSNIEAVFSNLTDVIKRRADLAVL